MRWRSVALALLLVGACGRAAEVSDTTCEQPADPVTALRDVAWPVVLGTVTEWDGKSATLRVEEVWRGFDLPATVELAPETGRAYTVGVRYLVFPENDLPPFVDEVCSATSRYTAELAALRPEQIRVVTPEPATDRDLPWEWLIGLALVVAAFVLVRRIREWRRIPPEFDPDHRLER